MFRRNLLICCFLGLLLGCYLWKHSDLPPYGNPSNELSNVYWGLIVDIAHKWRSGHISFWDQGVAGGMSLFTSGSYPVLFPTNLFACVLNDEQFYLFKIIEPYVLGFIFSALFFLHFMKIPLPFAVFGAFLYLGLNIGRHMTLPQTPIMMASVALFPLIPCFLMAWQKCKPYWAFCFLGAVIAMQFLLGGAGQFLQLIIWGTLYIILYFMFFVTGSLIIRLRHLILSSVLMVLLAVGLCAVQLMPTIHFVEFESARTQGTYVLNTFPLWKSIKNVEVSLVEVFVQSFLISNTKTTKTILILLIMSLIQWFCYGRRLLISNEIRKLFLCLWLTTLLYLCSPSLLVTSQKFLPSNFLIQLTKFSFSYGVHILDFMMVVSVCLAFSRTDLSIMSSLISKKRRMLSIILFSTVCIVWSILALMAMFNSKISNSNYILKHFISLGPKMLWGLCLTSIILSIYFICAARFFLFKFILGVVLVFFLFSTSFKSFWLSYIWNDKGKQTCLNQYAMRSPEYDFYKHARGKYFMPYDHSIAMSDNYNLLYGIKGSSGFLPVPPLRISLYIACLNGTCPKNILPSRKFNLHIPSSTVANYWPVDFTIIEHDKVLPWSNFSRSIIGDYYDIWQRNVPAKQVHLYYGLRIAKASDILENFDKKLVDQNVWVSQIDANVLNIRESLSSTNLVNVKYENFSQENPDHISFQTFMSENGFAVIPQMYSNGWEAWMDEKKVQVFPAQYLFLGVPVLSGKHSVVLKYFPPWFWWGMLINILSLTTILSYTKLKPVIFIYLWEKYVHRRP